MGKEEIIFQNCLSSFQVRSFNKSIKMLSSRTKCFLAILAQAILVSRCYAGPPAMTEVKFAGGSAGSTGVWDAQWTAEKAFMTPEHKANGWHKKRRQQTHLPRNGLVSISGRRRLHARQSLFPSTW